MNLKSEIRILSHQLDVEDEAAFNLWTWLPSYKDAKEKHGDYADEYRPTNADVMKEAAIYIGAGLDVTKVEKRVAEEWFKIPESF